ncbi:GriS protein [Streptomyces sp. Ru71]|uniref:NAD(P)-binding domain-containing protein n=1 Tax=Streptomyces sp. Ru71 TaxID=2080746 RepID=UPI000CDD9AAF|nr:NAD(P)-binding domain-containing protein [Streptomyces sp. Ru71]POX48609.1 GriS protein [Streptomyces sp. Ru71]
MKVGIIGAGDMGRAMARRAALAGAHVLLADPAEGRAREVAVEAAAGAPGGVVATSPTVAFRPEFVILALNRHESVCFLQMLSEEPDGKILVDVTAPPGRSPLDGRMRDLVTAYPQARWVRACAAGDAESIFRGDIDEQPVDVFVASDDENAKVRVIELANRSGLRALDAGGLDRARLLDEMVRLGSEISHQLAAVEGWGLKFLPSW